MQIVRTIPRSIALLLLGGVLGACSRETGNAIAQPVADGTGIGVSISFKVDPDPPRSGDNRLEVSVAKAGVPVSDATVAASFYMPAMPSMSMPEMRSTFALQPAGNGIYRGNGNLVMGGTWSVTVTALRAGESLGSSKFTVIAK